MRVYSYVNQVVISVIACLMMVMTSFSVGAEDVVYRGLGKYRDAYHTELLQAILDSSKPNHYKVKSFDRPIPHLRGFELLTERKDLDVMIGYATHERVQKYQAIEYPIMKGINGWRVALVHEDNANLLRGVTALKQLQNYIPGMFHTWTDNIIFSANGIDSIKGTDLAGIFRMLNTKRFDYFPLSILEAAREAELYKNQYDLAIKVDQHIIITYPVCFYFYVDKSNQVLAKDLNDGFENIVVSGLYDAIFTKHHKDIIKEYLTANRKVIRLTNPLLPDSVPLDRYELWLHYQYDENKKSTLY